MPYPLQEHPLSEGVQELFRLCAHVDELGDLAAPCRINASLKLVFWILASGLKSDPVISSHIFCTWGCAVGARNYRTGPEHGIGRGVPVV